MKMLPFTTTKESYEIDQLAHRLAKQEMDDIPNGKPDWLLPIHAHNISRSLRLERKVIWMITIGGPLVVLGSAIGNFLYQIFGGG